MPAMPNSIQSHGLSATACANRHPETREKRHIVDGAHEARKTKPPPAPLPKKRRSKGVEGVAESIFACSGILVYHFHG